MSKRTVLLAALGAFALVSAFAAVPVRAAEHEMATLVGCLNAGDAEGTYVLTPKEGGDPVTVTGDAETIGAHAGNHEVELGGHWVEGEGGEKTFAASSVEHLGVCE